MGIPLPEAEAWAAQRGDRRAVTHAAAGHEALLEAIEELRGILTIEDEPEEEEGARRRGRSAAEIRLGAATALGRMGLQLAKLEEARRQAARAAKGQEGRDLFDAATAGAPDPWAL